MIAMGKLALYLEKISEENKNNQFNEEIKMDFLRLIKEKRFYLLINVKMKKA